jgi:hypothetical protein
LRQIRQGLRTNQAVVDRTIKARIAASVHDDDNGEAPIFSHLGQEAPVYSAAQEQKLFSNITRKALGKGVIHIINHFYRGIGCGVCDAKKTQPKVQVVDEDEDPAYYSDYYYGAVNKRFQDKYHAVAGRAVFMEPADPSFQGLRGARLRKKVEQQQQQQQRVSSTASIPPRPKTIPLPKPNSVPVGEPAPPLVVFTTDRPKLIPLESVGNPVVRPKLVPVGNPVVRPKLVPIGNPAVRPKLVPIGTQTEEEPRRIRPPLVKPPKVEASLTRGVQRVNDGLPDFLDFLNKK